MKLKPRTLLGANVLLALAADGALPTEFRLFVKGRNKSEKGTFLFDDVAAKSVMAAYKSWGIDVPIDLEHQMLEVEGGAPDPTARDARGWCKLELRSDGSLWATNVRWTPDGAARLTEKRQRYISPAFSSDPDTKRVLKLVNIAITALPATHNTPALVAASAKGYSSMESSHIKEALDAIEAGDHDKAMGLLKAILASAAGAEPDGDEAGAEGDGAEGVKKESVEEPKVVAESAEEEPKEDDEEKPAKKVEAKAMNAMLCSLTGTKSVAEALSVVEAFRTSHMTLETETKKLAAERAVLESAERRQLVTKLVTLGAEFPSTVWADDKSTTIKARWVKMPIDELRSHVSDQTKARNTKKPADGVKPGAAVGSNVVDVVLGLDARELEICKSTGCDPKAYAELKALRAEGK